MEEARAEFRTKIDATISKFKSCKSDTNRDDEEIDNEWQLKAMEIEGRFDSLLG